MKIYYRIISFILCCVMVFSLCACNGGNSAGGQVSLTPPSNTDFWGKPNDTPSQGGGSGWDTDLTPDINVTIIGGGSTSDETIYDNLEGEETVYDLVYENISYSLTNI